LPAQRRRRPVSGFSPRGFSHLDDEPKRNGAGEDADERKGCRVDARLLERQSAEQGVSRERDHRDQRKDQKSCRFHFVTLQFEQQQQWRDISEVSLLTRNSILHSSPRAGAIIHSIMKLKNLRKKIRRLEKRLEEGPRKLAKLKRKLEAMVAADAQKARMKSAPRLTLKPQVKPARATRPSAARKVKRKLNLSPERRAQLAAAMKARWAAKRAAAEASAQDTSTDRDLAPGQAPQTP
jgi:hypothetical protein